MPYFTDDLEPIVISPLLAILMGIVGALVLLAIIIIMIMKLKTEEDLRSIRLNALNSHIFIISESSFISDPEKICINSINRLSNKYEPNQKF